jgi:hypothetical protein
MEWVKVNADIVPLVDFNLMKTRICIVVAGMHRSGTSALTRIFRFVGCDLPNTLLGANETNETGHWESQVLIQFNDALLDSAGTSWDDWTPFPMEWLHQCKAAQFRAQAAQQFRSEFGSSRLMAFKDPRLCRLLPFWLDVLKAEKIRPLIVMPVRNPLEVAASLARRDGSETTYNQLVWLRQVLEAEFFSRGEPRYFCSYDDLLKSWDRVIDGAERAFNIEFPNRLRANEEAEAYLSSKYRHHTGCDSSDMLPPVRRVYEILLDWVNGKIEESDFEQFDLIRSELDRSSATFGPLVTRGKLAVARLSEAERVRDDLVSAVARLEQQLADEIALSRARAIHIEAFDAPGAIKEQLTLRCQAMEAELAGLRAKLDGLSGEAEAAMRHAQSEKEARMQTHQDFLVVTERLEGARKQIVQLEETVAHYRRQYDLLWENVEQQRSELRAELSAMEQKLAAKEAVIESARAEADTMRLSLKMAEQDIAHLSERFAQSDQRRALAEANVAQRTAEVEDRHAEIRELMATLHRESDARIKAEAELLNLRVEVGKLEQARTDAAKAIQSKEAVLQQVRTLVSALATESDFFFLRGHNRRRHIAAVKQSGIVDESWYLSTYDDVAQSGMDPSEHYLQIGAREGRLPAER